MKSVILLFGLLGSSMASASHVIEVTEPAFTAEKIEFNSVTSSYVVVNPKYYVNAKDAVKIVTYGLSDAMNIDLSKTAQHLCTFLGMSGGKIISTSTVRNYACKGNTLTIQANGIYGLTQYTSAYRDCEVADFLECSPK